MGRFGKDAFKDTAEELLNCGIPWVADQLGLKVRPSTTCYYLMPGPMSPAAGASSFIIFKNGSWKDFAAGKHGDLVALIGHVLGHHNQLDSLKTALSYLGKSEGEYVPVDPGVQAARQRQREADAAKEREDRLAYGKKLVGAWSYMVSAQGTAGEAYLRGKRRLPLDLLPEFPSVLHFEPQAEHIDDDGVVTNWDAIVSPFYKGSTPLALHKIFLAPRGTDKAPVYPSRKMYGPMRGGAIRISRGEGQLTVAKAIKKNHQTYLALGEGVETMTGVACVRPDFRCWAAGSLVNMDLEWEPHMKGVMLVRENDWKPPAMKQFEAIKAHWEHLAKENGGVVWTYSPENPAYSDPNDELMND